MRIPSDVPPRMERNVSKRLEEGNAGRNNVGEDDERKEVYGGCCSLLYTNRELVVVSIGAGDVRVGSMSETLVYL